MYIHFNKRQLYEAYDKEFLIFSGRLQLQLRNHKNHRTHLYIYNIKMK